MVTHRPSQTTQRHANPLGISWRTNLSDRSDRSDRSDTSATPPQPAHHRCHTARATRRHIPARATPNCAPQTHGVSRDAPLCQTGQTGQTGQTQAPRPRRPRATVAILPAPHPRSFAHRRCHHIARHYPNVKSSPTLLCLISIISGGNCIFFLLCYIKFRNILF